jgi:hypothetical protein
MAFLLPLQPNNLASVDISQIGGISTLTNFYLVFYIIDTPYTIR